MEQNYTTHWKIHYTANRRKCNHQKMQISIFEVKWQLDIIEGENRG